MTHAEINKLIAELPVEERGYTVIALYWPGDKIQCLYRTNGSAVYQMPVSFQDLRMLYLLRVPILNAETKEFWKDLIPQQ